MPLVGAFERSKNPRLWPDRAAVDIRGDNKNQITLIVLRCGGVVGVGWLILLSKCVVTVVD